MKWVVLLLVPASRITTDGRPGKALPSNNTVLSCQLSTPEMAIAQALPSDFHLAAP